MRLRIIFALFAALSAASGCREATLDPEFAGRPISRDETPILFIGVTDGVREVYATDERGERVVRVTTNDFFEGSGDFSPSADRFVIALFRWEDDNYTSRLHLLDADGTVLGPLLPPTSQHPQNEPLWSPDGSKIVFQSWDRALNSEILVAASDGTGLTALRPAGMLEVRDPSWHPSGERILFSGKTGTRIEPEWELYSVKPDGSGLVQITATPDEYEFSPVYSPDGSQMLYAVHKLDVESGGAQWITELRIGDSDLDNQLLLVSEPGANHVKARWAAGAGRILYSWEAERDESANGLYMISPAGGQTIRIPTGSRTVELLGFW